MKAPLVSFFLCGAAAFSSAQFPGTTAKVSKDLEGGFKAISKEDAKSLLGYLAGPETAGRGTGQPGYDLAAKFVANKFKEYGIQPIMPDGSYFHTNDFWRTRIDPSSIIIANDSGTVRGAMVGAITNGTFDFSGEAYFIYANGPVQLPTDLSGQLEGKLVFLVNKSGANRLPNQVNAKGCAATVVVQDTVSEPGWQGRARETRPSASAPILSISTAAFNSLVNESERSIPSGTTGLVVKKLSGSFAGKATSVVEKIKVANVVGVLPGSDPVLKSEFIGVGSHLDHLGNVGGTVYYGADDDGSGTTAVLMVAKGLAANKLKPKRSTVFMAFYGEEMGLLGSAYLANNPPFDLSKMVAELQLDMVGRDSDGAQNGDMNRIDKASENTDTIRLVGSKRISTTLDTIIQEQNKFIGFRFKYDAEDVYTRSDHYNFAAKGIPIAFFFSGFHPDYHQPTDTVEKINYDKITNTAKLVYLTTHAVAARPGRLPKDVPQG